MNLIEKNKYENLEIDARLTIFSKFYLNQFNLIPKNLTFYMIDPNGITSEKKNFQLDGGLEDMKLLSTYSLF